MTQIDSADESNSSDIGSRRGVVLVVDDNDTIRQMLEMMLSKMSLDCALACDAPQAIKLFQERSFAMVIMDWHMPTMDGIECTKRLRELETSGNRTVIIGCTAHALAADVKRCLENMDDVLTKPFTFGELSEKVRKWIPDVLTECPV